MSTFITSVEHYLNPDLIYTL